MYLFSSLPLLLFSQWLEDEVDDVPNLSEIWWEVPRPFRHLGASPSKRTEQSTAVPEGMSVMIRFSFGEVNVLLKKRSIRNKKWHSCTPPPLFYIDSQSLLLYWIFILGGSFVWLEKRWCQPRGFFFHPSTRTSICFKEPHWLQYECQNSPCLQSRWIVVPKIHNVSCSLQKEWSKKRSTGTVLHLLSRTSKKDWSSISRASL